MSKDFLDVSYLKEFIRIICDNSNILKYEKKFENFYPFAESIRNELEKSINWINKYSNPENDSDFFNLIMSVYTLKSSIIKLSKILKLKEIDKKTEFFIDHYFQNYDKYKEKMNDETFFSFLRSITCAHTTSTKCNSYIEKFMSKNQVFFLQYIDFNVEKRLWYKMPTLTFDKKIFAEKRKNLISLKINSILKADIVDDHFKSIELLFSLDSLKKYIQYYYSFLEKVNSKIKTYIKEIENEWLKEKIDDKLSYIEQYKQILKILNKRYIIDTDKIEQIINILETKSTEKNNDEYINNYKKYFIDVLPKIKKILTEEVYIDIDNIFNSFFSLCSFAKKVIDYEHVEYLIEKIYAYIYNEQKTLKNVENIEYIYRNNITCSNEEWGLSCLKVLYLLSKKYLKTEIIMDFNKMEYNELILLIETIFYNEYLKGNYIENE